MGGDAMESLVNVVLGMQNVQMELMSMLQGVHKELSTIKDEIKQISDKDTRIEDMLNDIRDSGVLGLSTQSERSLNNFSVRSVATKKAKGSEPRDDSSSSSSSGEFLPEQIVLPKLERREAIRRDEDEDSETEEVQQLVSRSSGSEQRHPRPRRTTSLGMRRGSMPHHMMRIKTMITGLDVELDEEQPRQKEKLGRDPQAAKLSSKELSMEEDLANFKFRLTCEEMFSKNATVYHSDDSESTERREKSFDSFSLISCNESSTNSNNIIGWGESYLNPLMLKSGSVIDKYPQTGEILSKANDAIFQFAFPEGLAVRIIPQCAIIGARRLGWMGDKADRYQLHNFQDIKGDKAFGISITIREEMKLSNSEELMLLRAKFTAAAKIQNFWRNQRDNESENSLRKSIERLGEKSGFMLFRSPAGASQVKKSSASRSMQLKSHARCTKLAIQSYNHMKENFDLGYTCIVEQCYMLIGTDPQCHSLLFSLLARIITLEKAEMLASRGSFTLLTQKALTFKRHKMLEEVLYNVHLTEEQALVTYPVDDWEHAYGEKPFHEIFLEYPLPNLSFTLPLPQMSSEWGVARLILRIKLPNLLVLIQLLMLERSVLVIGESYEEVTACAFALVDLLKPYKWESVFMSQLSENMMDFISSPVPYIIGAARCEKLLQKIRTDSRVKKEITNGLNIVDLSQELVTWSEEKKLQQKLLITCKNNMNYWFRSSELKYYQERMEFLAAQNKNSALHDFSSFFLYGASNMESLVIQSIKDSIQEYLLNLSGLLAVSSDGWMVYTRQREGANKRHFVSKKFHRPLHHMVEFQKEFSRSQLLASFYEERKNQYEGYKKNARKGLLIADWLYFAWYKYKKRMNKDLSNYPVPKMIT